MVIHSPGNGGWKFDFLLKRGCKALTLQPRLMTKHIRRPFHQPVGSGKMAGENERMLAAAAAI